MDLPFLVPERDQAADLPQPWPHLSLQLLQPVRCIHKLSLSRKRTCYVSCEDRAPACLHRSPPGARHLEQYTVTEGTHKERLALSHAGDCRCREGKGEGKAASKKTTSRACAKRRRRKWSNATLKRYLYLFHTPEPMGTSMVISEGSGQRLL